MLLLLGGMANGAWADTKTVTYHVITLPFGGEGLTYASGETSKAYRIEAIKKTVTYTYTGTAPDVDLPSELKSPLLENSAYSYYTEVNITKQVKIFPNNTSLYDTFEFTEFPLESGTKVSALTDNADIYVKYEYDDDDKTSLGKTIDLKGDKVFNIELKGNNGSGSWFYALNMDKERGNRMQAIPATDLNNFSQLCTPGPHKIKTANESRYNYNFTWKLVNNDPYNIILQTAYNKQDFSYYEPVNNRNYWKKANDARFFTNLKCKDPKNDPDVFGSFGQLLLTNEWRYKWPTETGKSTGEPESIERTDSPGWWRNESKGGESQDIVPSANTFPDHLLFSFSLLKHPTANYTLVASWVNVNNHDWVPNSSDNYVHMMHTPSKYPGPAFVSFRNADQILLHEVREYTYKVKTPFYPTAPSATEEEKNAHIVSAKFKMSDYEAANNLTDRIPVELRRKYVSYEAYKEEGFTTKETTFQDAIREKGQGGDDDKIEVWLNYSVSLPFNTLPVDGSYINATWYTIRLNGDVETQYLGYLEGNNFYTGGGKNDDLHYGENNANAQFAFIGDPYELKIISRGGSETAKANRYVGTNTNAENNTTLTLKEGSSDISTWEIVYETTQPGNMILREFGKAGEATPTYIGWGYGEDNNPMRYSTSYSRIRVVELSTKKYRYHIVRNDAGDIAAMAIVDQEYGVKLEYSSIPEIIRSPFLALDGVEITFYSDLANAKTKTNPIANGSNDAVEYEDIWVRYDMGTALESSPGWAIAGGDNSMFNVRLNGEYIYYDSSTNSIKSTSSVLDNATYQWKLGGSDPYALTIQAEGNSEQFITVANWAAGTVTWSSSAPASKFILKAGSYDGSYEVMAATGDYVNASETYYNFGRTGDNAVKMYNNEGAFMHGYDAIRFYLEAVTAVNITYHLIDRKGRDLIQVEARQAPGEKPHFPDEYRSPLVPDEAGKEGYHYWIIGNFTVTGSKYELKTEQTEVTSISATGHIYVTYDIGDEYDMINKKDMFLLKFEAGTPFRAEDGSDGMESAPITPVYPYCNGDCNFFVYGQAQFDLQQQGAASTRTRWAWFLESDDNDPYHVKICSRQTDTYNGDEVRAYFSTYQPSGYNEIVTNLVWPSISGLKGSEYMILGTDGHYRLMTTETVPLDADNNGTPESNERVTVKSFEQYWKTYDTVKNKLLKDILEESDKGANPSGSITVPYTPESYRALLRGEYGFHSYSNWAYAKRFNGYNAAGKTSKGWEEVEHWFQTVDMNEGYFDLIPIEINPVLILLDQHGWEIMRKPLPNSPEDETKWAKFDEIRPYDSPMVESYYFWTKASKRSGFHQYYNLSQQITVDGKAYTSTSLTSLPPYDSPNVKDAKGNLLDQYVTYTVKDEYVKSVSVSYTTESARDADSNDYTRITAVTGTGVPFLIQQGSTVADADATVDTKTTVPTPGGMSQYIIDNIAQLWPDAEKANELWYLMPNFDIDDEMGYSDPTIASGINWVNDYRNQAKVKASGFNSWAFDPYNIQISSVSYAAKYFVTNATAAELDNGSIIGTYGDAATVELGNQKSIPGDWHDSRKLAITNATFMAVQDADGHMQLMPRFDQTKRMKDFSTLVSPKAADIDQTYTQLFHPFVYNYIIVDNQGRESLRYKSGGDLVPQTPDHFKSPLAKDYTYYKDLTATAGVYNLKDIGSKEITASLVGADLKTEKVSNENQVYVRYKYDAEADVLKVLQGKWLTMQLNKKDVQYTTVGETAGIYADADTPTKPASVDQDAKTWQWKLLESPQSDPDPYAVQLFNRSNAGTALPTDDTRFALLRHTAGDYALAVARSGSDAEYNFLNGTSMTSSVAATTATESGFLSTSCAYDGTGSQVKLTDEVLHSYTYKVYTHGGVEAVSAEQAYSEASENDFVPVLPSEIQTPLLGINKFRYYENLTDTAYSSGHPLTHLYGLYDDVVYVRYNAYDPKATNYLVPNVKGTEGGHVAKGEGSNDTPLRIDGKLPYNIIWYNDNMMGSNESGITDGGSQTLIATDTYKWYLEGDDPYAIKIKNKAGKYVYSSDDVCSLDDDASTFMLLPRSGYDYGVLQKTATSKMLSGYGNTLVENTEPEHFIIFAMATYDVIYHLVIANIIGDNTKTIPYAEKENGVRVEKPDKKIYGSTQRDLTSKYNEEGTPGEKYQLGETVNGQTYCKKVGPISLGDSLRLPEVLKRPNCKYFYYVEGIYNNMDCEESNAISELNNKYKGLQAKYMGEDEALIHTYVRINVEYQFDDGLPTNSGSNFVSGVGQNRWYTFETVRKEGEDEIPWLAQFTNAWGCELKKGRGTHYTNDYLWSPIGDPYGFIMYNRYIYLNSGDNNTGEENRVMTTDAFSEGQKIIMSKNEDPTDTEKANSVYELLTEEETTSGYFLVHPVVNNEGTKYYLGIVSGDDDSDGITNDYLKLSTTAQELTFGLTEELVKPYYDRAGYVGGLTPEGKAAYETAGKDLMAKQEVVYNLGNIVEFDYGYYRLHSPSDIDGVTERYASGYNHKIEETGVPGSSVHTGAVPMHFYERKGVNTTYEVLGSGFTFSEATRGALPVSAPEYDPASIINFAQVPTTISSTENTNPKMAILTTQGLYVKSPVAKGGDEEGKKTNAIMTSTKTDATSLYVMDIGGAIMLIHDNHVADSRAKLKYLSYDQTDADHIYDLKLTHNTNTDHAKWLMEPANEQGLKVTTNSGGDGYYYATFCAPFDVLLKGADDVAYISKKWETNINHQKNIIHLKKIGKYNKGTYADNNKFIPAGTAVIIRTPTVGDVSMSLPGTVTPKISECIFAGKYLEQKLDVTETVYTFGLPYVSEMKLEDKVTGVITSTHNQKDMTGVGFYINANPNKELGLARDSWERNNHYVLHNKIYYLDSGSGSSRQGRIEDNKEFIPVVFDDNDEEDEPISERLRQWPADNRVYDLQGRCVASGEAVRNGSWRNMVAPGVYIVNGKKVKL